MAKKMINKFMRITLSLCLALSSFALFTVANKQEAMAADNPQHVIGYDNTPPQAFQQYSFDANSMRFLSGTDNFELRNVDGTPTIFYKQRIPNSCSNSKISESGFSVIFPESAKDIYGNKIDVVTKITNMTAGAWGAPRCGTSVELSVMTISKTELSLEAFGHNPENDVTGDNGIRCQMTCDFEVEYYYAGTQNKFLSEKQVVYEFRDIDQPEKWYDKSQDADFGGTGNGFLTAYQNTYYTEHIQMKSGFRSYLSEADFGGSKWGETYLLKKALLDGFQNIYGTESNDEYTWRCAFRAVTNSQGCKFNWGGSRCNTRVLSLFKENSGIKLIKTSTEKSPFSLAGAVYGIYSDDGCKNKVKEMITDSNGVAVSNEKGLDLEPKTYYVKEITAPKGYAIDPKVYPIDCIAGSVATLNVKDTPIRGGVKVQKRDAESKELSALGGASLDNTEFEIKSLNDYSVVIDDKEYAKNQVVKTISIKNGEAQTTSTALPYGKYSIQEIKSGTGYILSDTTEREFSITEHNKIIEPFTNNNSFFNNVIRGDVEFVKAKNYSQKRMSGIPFLITSTTTGESHVVVTDANGEAKTKSEWNKHSQDTNANDSAVTKSKDGDWVVDERKLNASSGVWFGKTKTGALVSVNDNFGALPFDTYKIEELSVKANANFEKIVLDKVIVSKQNYSIDLGTLDDQEIELAQLSTKVRNENDGTQQVKCFGESKVVDRVDLKHINASHSYKLIGTLMNKNTGEVFKRQDGTNYETSLEFDFNTSDLKQEYIDTYKEVTFTINGADFIGKEVVAFEELFDLTDNVLVATHNDFDDFNQTFKVDTPEIETDAFDKIDGDKFVVADENSIIVDKVKLKGLSAGSTYTLKAELFNAETNQSVLSNNKPVTGEASVFATGSFAETNIELKLNTQALTNANLVVVERLFAGDQLLAEHVDLKDKRQTVSVVATSLKTNARDKMDGDNTIIPNRNSVIVDKVSYSNALAGCSYILKGWIVEKQAGTPLQSSRGNVLVEKELVVNKPNGYLEIEFNFDTSDYKQDTEFVVFEEFYKDGIKVAEHKDINDKNQTIKLSVPSPKNADTNQEKKDGMAKTGDDVERIMLALLAIVLLTVILSYASYCYLRIKEETNNKVGDKNNECKEE